MSDPFKNRSTSLSGPVRDIVPVTPDDGQDLADVAVALYVEIGGALTITTVQGTQRTVDVADWSVLPVGVRRVHASGTSATGIHAMVH